jgi:hypothetical protein
VGIMVSRVNIQEWPGGGAGLWVYWLAGLVCPSGRHVWGSGIIKVMIINYDCQQQRRWWPSD